MAHRHRSPVCVQVAGAERVGAGERDSTTQTVAAWPTCAAPQLTADEEGKGPAEPTGMVQQPGGPARCLCPTCCLPMGPAGAPREASGRPSTHRWGERAADDQPRAAQSSCAWLSGAGRARRGNESTLWDGQLSGSCWWPSSAWRSWPAHGFRWRGCRRPTPKVGRRRPHLDHRLPHWCPPDRLRRPAGCSWRWGPLLRTPASCPPSCPSSCPPSP
mmetsp:Transcript_36829/g.105536  ORF Transcript_36829/g.105536 Transcript_36829/m.105536 type:complete len:216 (-) Transcript_36829:1690-2337(-)